METCVMRCAKKWVANVHKRRYKCMQHILLYCISDTSKSNGNLLSALSLSPRNSSLPPSHRCEYGSNRWSAVHSNKFTVTFNQISLGNFVNERGSFLPKSYGVWRSTLWHQKHINMHATFLCKCLSIYRTTHKRRVSRQSSLDVCLFFFSLVQIHPTSAPNVCTQNTFIQHTRKQATMHLIRTFYPSLCLICTTMQKQIHMECVCTHHTVACCFVWPTTHGKTV